MSMLIHEWQRIRKSPLAHNAGWLLAGQGSGLLLQAAYFVILARLLGVVEYGVFVGAFAFTGLVGQYGPLGTGTLLMRYVSGERQQFAVYWGNLLLVTLSMGTLLVLALHLLAPRLLNPRSASLVLLAATANCLCAQITVETARIFQTFEQMHTTAILNLLTNFMRTLIAGVMLVVSHHASAWQWAVASTIVSAVAAGLAVIIVTVRFGWPRFQPRLFLKHGTEGFGYAFASSTSSVYNDIDKTMLSHYGMNMANGIYTMAYRVVDIATIPILSIRDAALPRFFQRGRSGIEPAADLSTRLLKRALPLGIVAAIGMFVAAPLIPPIIGHGFSDSVAALRWLCLIPIFRSAHQMTGSALTGSGLQSYRTVAQGTAAGLNLGLNLWLIPCYGWRGAAWSSLVTDAVLGVGCWGILKMLMRHAQVTNNCQEGS